MPYRLFIALGAGLVSAIVFASATTGPRLVQMFLFLLTPLALYLAGVGLGPLAAVVAGIAGTALVLAAGGVLPALAFAALQAVPVALLIYLASLNRQTPVGVEWYPPGRIVIAAALLAGGLVGLLFMFSGDVETLRTSLRDLLKTLADNELPKMPDAPTLGPNDIDELTAVLLPLLPATSAIAMMGSHLLNLWLAGHITFASGRLTRPWPDLAAMVYPPATPLILVLAIGAGFLPGIGGMVGAAFAGTLFLAYVLLGLAVVHYVTRGQSWRPFALLALYAALFIANPIAPLAIALLGLADSIWPIRKFPAPRAGRPPG